MGSESSPLEAMCELGLERLEAVCSLRFFERNFWPHRFTAFLFASEGEKSFAVDASILFSENLSLLLSFQRTGIRLQMTESQRRNHQHSPGSFSGTARQLFPLRCSEESLPLHLHAWKLVEREGPIKHTFFYRNSLFSVLAVDRKWGHPVGVCLSLACMLIRKPANPNRQLRFFSRRISVSWFECK